MATVGIQRRKRKKHTSYMANFKDPRTGQKKYFKSFRKFKEAQLSAQTLRSLIDNGKLGEIKKNRNKLNLLTFKEVAKTQVKVWEKRKNKKKIMAVTFEGYVIRVHVLNRSFGDRLICQISKTDILDYQEKILNDFSAITSNRSLFVIKQVFKQGIENQALIVDPSAEITYLSEKNHERNLFLKPIGIKELVEASQETRAKFYMPALIYLGAEHGASKQEALSLQWDDLDFSFEGQGLIRLFRTKNGKERTEYLMPRTKRALLDWKKHLEWMRYKQNIQVMDDKFVFCRLNGKPIKRFDKAWRQTCQIANFRGLHYHDLRHTFCSNLLLSGSDLKDVKEMIGHRDISMTDRYSHLTNHHKRSRQNMLAEYYDVL